MTHCSVDYIDRNAFCPSCYSYPRHRGFIWLLENVLRSEVTSISKSSTLALMIAPEPGLFRYLEHSVGHIEGLDIMRRNELVSREEDLQALTLSDRSVDFIACFHVLEHVPDDRRALSELSRVLKPSGSMALCVPITFGVEKTREFGFADPRLNGHCFDYGEDFPERLVDAGFRGRAFRFSTCIPRPVWERLALVDETVYWIAPAIDEPAQITDADALECVPGVD